MFRWIFSSRKLVSVNCDHTCANVMKCAGVSIYSLVLIMVVRGILDVGVLSAAFSLGMFLLITVRVVYRLVVLMLLRTDFG